MLATRNCIFIFFVFGSFAASASDLEKRIAQLESENQCSFGFEGDALYWKASENGLPYGTASRQMSGITNGQIKNVKMDWQWGFRVGFRGVLPKKKWMFALDWTHFHTDTHNRFFASQNQILFPIWTNPLFSEGKYAETTRARWRLHLGIVDFALSYPITVGNRFVLNPGFGIRSAWIRQKYLLDFFGGTLAPDDQDKLHMKNKFSGVGPLAQLGLNFSLGKGFALTGEGKFSLPYGQFYIHQSEDTNTQEDLLQIHSNFKKLASIEDLSLGALWKVEGLPDNIGIKIKASWETHFYDSQNQLPLLISSTERGANSSNNGDLTIRGYVFGAEFTY